MCIDDSTSVRFRGSDFDRSSDQVCRSERRFVIRIVLTQRISSLIRRRSQRAGRATLSGFFSGFFGRKAFFFGWLEHPLYSRSTSRLVQRGKIVADRVLEAETTPPDRFARR